MSRKSLSLAAAVGVIAASGLVINQRDGISTSLGSLLGVSVSEARAQDPGKMPAPQVPVAEVVVRDIAPSAEFTGHLAAAQNVELRPRVSGAIDSVSVPEGGLVRKDQLLFQIDARPYQATVDSAQAQLLQAEVQLAQAETDYKRTKTLAPNGTVSQKTYDDALSTMRQREAQLQGAKAALAAARLDLSFTSVRAPIDGRVDRVLVTEGNLVSGGAAGTATLLTTIVSTDPIHAYFDIDETTYLSFVDLARTGASGAASSSIPVSVGLMTDKDFPYTGLLDFLGNSVDRSTGTIRARASIANADGRLSPGLFARVKLATGTPRQAVLIDDQAIGADQSMRFVLVLGEGNMVDFRPVVLGPIVDGLRVVSNGLKPGDKVSTLR